MFTSSAIFTLSWDEGAGWSDRQLDIACAMTPWFFFVGNILTFCALFTKLWRVDKVLQFKRRAVTISNVMKPWYVVGNRSRCCICHYIRVPLLIFSVIFPPLLNQHRHHDDLFPDFDFMDSAGPVDLGESCDS